MITREELLKSPEYWFENAQNDLYRYVVEFMEKENINQSELAVRLGVSKGYVSQILKGEFNYTLKTLIELSLAMGWVPTIKYTSVKRVIEEDRPGKPHKSDSTKKPLRTGNKVRRQAGLKAR